MTSKGFSGILNGFSRICKGFNGILKGRGWKGFDGVDGFERFLWYLEGLNALGSVGLRRCSPRLKPKPNPQDSKSKDRKFLTVDTREPWTHTSRALMNRIPGNDLKIRRNPVILQNPIEIPGNPPKFLEILRI